MASMPKVELNDLCDLSKLSNQKLLTELIRRIEDRPPWTTPLRPPMEDTPNRVSRAWQEVFSGYAWDDERIARMLTQFDEPCNQMVVLRQIEFYSTCEHHWMQFEGMAHIGYIPQNNKVVGVSKLARLLEVYSRRFQIQERIGQQIVEALNKYVSPHAACILVGSHSCMRCRGIGKQHSEMITSARTGCFTNAEEDSWREFQTLIAL